MINSANTVDLNLKNNNVLLPPAIVPLEKFKLVHTSKRPQVRENFIASYGNMLNQYFNAADGDAKANSQTVETKEIASQMNTLIPKQRVHVQHLQTHPNLQNNRFTCNTFYNLSSTAAHSGPDMSSNNNRNSNSNNNNNNNNNNIIIRKESAFKQVTLPGIGNPVFIGTPKHDDIVEVYQSWHASERMGDSKLPSDRTINRTEYQENAYLRIEEVHNYAKSDRYSYSNESSNSSLHEEENDDEDEDLDEDITRNYERFVSRGKHLPSRNYKANTEVNELKVDNVKVSESKTTIVQQERQRQEPESVTTNAPDHHARRPMNAFLIFCKRHRAIVKDRYKSLENRAITKILGDWWASLDPNDKKCFTNLAQQNKDAFFSANPNFKWYKLPAPPLRTLNTRPSNAERTLDQELEEGSTTSACNNSSNKCRTTSGGHYFKLANEAEMGELSTLINGENNNNSNTNHSALQQALGETTQFLSAYMPHTNDINSASQLGKRRLHSENSFSSNSSEEEAVPKKSSRSCKGKIYQELINSGQISAVAKKIKSGKTQNCPNGYIRAEAPQHATAIEVNTNVSSCDTALTIKDSSPKRDSDKPDSNNTQQHCDLVHFDLEEKIKELPALSLDLYLQRKRNTKKKKKFSSKKRNSNSVSSNKSSSSLNMAQSPPVTPPKRVQEPPQQQAVGSQKRKARKESITRRDVSAIENEIASLIPLPTSFNTINGCYIFNESPDPTEMTALTVNTANTASTVISPTGANNQNASAFGNFTDNISSTSDLLILAEVAANRTELTN